MIGWSLAPKWPILAPFCGMDHQNSISYWYMIPFLSEAVEASRCHFFKNRLKKKIRIMKTNFECHLLFSQRLLRPVYVTFSETGWWNSNFQTSGIYRYLQAKSNLHISICQSHFKRNSSMWNTLYFHQDFYLFPIAGAMFVVNGGVYALSAPVWGYLCDKRLPPIIVTLLGSVCIAVAFLFIGPVPFIPVPTSLGLCIGMLFIHGLGFAAQLVAAFSSAHSEALIAGKAFKIVTKMFKFLNQCFARLRFWKSVSSKTAVAPSSRFRKSETLFQTEVMQNTDLRI